MNKQQKNLQNVSRFSLIVLITICITRLWSISLFYIFGKNSQIIERIISDSWHHYQVGLALVVVAFLLRKHRKIKFLLAIGLGIFLEEWPVFLSDVGLNTNHLYHTKLDFISIVFLVGLVYILSKTLYFNINLKKI